MNIAEKNYEEKLNKLKYCLYIEKDFKMCSNLFDNVFTEFMSSLPLNLKVGIKHKCNRDINCLCIELGKLLISIGVNSSPNIDIFNLVEKYYHSPNINLPYPLFKYLVLNMLKYSDFQKVRSNIENYLTYSKLEIVKGSNLFYLDEKSFEELNDILIFDVILTQSGFTKAKTKILNIQNTKLKNQFLDKYYSILKKYTGESDIEKADKLVYDLDNIQSYPDRNKYDPNLLNKLNDIVDKQINTNLDIDTNYSGFTVKNSIVFKFISLFSNRKFLMFIFAFVIFIFVKRFLRYKKWDDKIIRLILQLWSKLKTFPLISGISSFVSGIFTLLINY